MTTQAKVLRILQVLDNLYPDPPVPLNHTSEFTFLVAVVLSAQTTDGKVNEVTKELFSRADTPQKMMNLPVEEVQRIIQPVGLAPKKAQYVVGLSRKLVENFGGRVPSTYEELESLPGVGHKTASVIRSQCFGHASLAVDTHVHRLSLRWGLSKEQRNVDKVQADLCASFPEASWNRVHLQMIYFGREYCPAKSHVPSECPVCSWVTSSTKNPPTDLSTFSPQKRAKGLVYYHDRRDELQGNPSLALFCAASPDRRVALLDSIKSEPIGNSGREFVEALEDDIIAIENGPLQEKAKPRKRDKDTTSLDTTEEQIEPSGRKRKVTTRIDVKQENQGKRIKL